MIINRLCRALFRRRCILLLGFCCYMWMYHSGRRDAVRTENRDLHEDMEQRMRVTNAEVIKEHKSRLTPEEMKANLDVMTVVPLLRRNLILYRRIQVAYCPIEKNVNTQFRALLCRANADDDTPSQWFKMRVVDPVTVTKLCHGSGQEEYHPMREHMSRTQRRVLESNLWNRFSVLRDPFDRFISAYLFRCARIAGSPRTCYNCPENDFPCVIQQNLEHMEALSRGSTPTKPMLVPPEDSQEAQHMYPQAWYCYFRDDEGNQFPEPFRFFHFKAEGSDANNFRWQLRQYLKNVVKIRSDLLEKGWGLNLTTPFLGVGASHNNPQSDSATTVYWEQLMADITLANNIFKTYYSDYVRFQFSIPRFIYRLCLRDPDQFKRVEVCYAIRYLKMSVADK